MITEESLLTFLVFSTFAIVPLYATILCGKFVGEFIGKKVADKIGDKIGTKIGKIILARKKKHRNV